MTYVLNSKTLSELLNASVEIVDRTKLPHERIFASMRFDQDQPFTRKQMSERVRAVLDQCPLYDDDIYNRDWASSIACNPYACGSMQLGEGRKLTSLRAMTPHLSEIYDGLGYGDTLPVEKAVLCGTTNALSDRASWDLYLGLPVQTARPFSIKEFQFLHEIGHLVFPIDCNSSIVRAHHKELMAECWSSASAENFGISHGSVMCNMRSRALDSFAGSTSPIYFLAPGVEAYLAEKPIPSFRSVFEAVRELQHRTYFGLEQQKTSHMNRIQLKTEKGICAVNTKTGERVGSWTDECNFFYPAFAKHPVSRVMTELKKQMERCRLLDDFTRKVGEDALKAYEHFCPEEARDALRPARRLHDLAPRAAA